MDVDEAGRDDAISRVDHSRRAPARGVADIGDAAGGDRHVGPYAWSAGPVDDDAAANEEVGHPRRSRPAPRSRRLATTSSFGDAPPAGDPS